MPNANANANVNGSANANAKYRCSWSSGQWNGTMLDFLVVLQFQGMEKYKTKDFLLAQNIFGNDRRKHGRLFLQCLNLAFVALLRLPLMVRQLFTNVFVSVVSFLITDFMLSGANVDFVWVGILICGKI